MFASNRSRLIALLGLFSAAFCVLLVTDWFPWLRGDVPWLPGDLGWRWPYEAPRWLAVVPSILGVVVYIVGALALVYKVEERGDRKFPVRLILWAFVGAVLLPLLLMTMEGSPLYLLFTRAASTLTGGFLYASVEISDLSHTLRDWTGFVLEYRKLTPFGGIALSPPGLAATFYSIAHGIDAVPGLAPTLSALVRPLECQNLTMMAWPDSAMASAWPQIFMPLWTALAVAPLYRLGVYIFDRRTARWAVVLWPLIPGLDMFAPRFNTFYALVAVVMVLLLWRGLEQRHIGWVLVAGFIVSVTVFINLSVVPLGLLGGLTIIGQWIRGIQTETAKTRRRLSFDMLVPLIVHLVVFGIGSASAWVIYSGLSGVSPVEVIRLALGLHMILNRPYVPWLFMHTYDVFLFIGLPVAALSIWPMLKLIKDRKMVSRGDVFAAAAGLTLFIMVMSGTARGETGRVWLFFAPLWILLAARLLRDFSNRQQAAFMVMQAACLLCMMAVLRGNFTTLTVPPTVPAADHGPTFALNSQFVRGDDKFTLVGIDVDKGPTGVTLHFHWRADGFIKHPYQLVLVPVPPDKSTRQSINWDPLNWNYPPSCWSPGQTFVDTVSVPDSAKAGDWLFSLSAMDIADQQPMQIAGQANTTQIGIGPVTVPAQ